MLERMEKQAYETKRLDHLGIVAGVCKRINLIEIVNEMLPSPIERKVSCGQATQAMVLNALGLSGRALYLMPEYMKNKPVELLVGEGVQAKDFNDDTLGRALDEIQQAGVTSIFAKVAAEAVRVYEIETKYAHVDSSSFSLQGEYESEYAQNMAKVYEAVEIRRGYSKDKRPDLKQVVVNLITSQASALPLWLEVLDGNSSDKTTFKNTVDAYCQQLAEGDEAPWFIMDSAGYSYDNLHAFATVKWLTRVPETLSVARESLKIVVSKDMVEVDDNYKIYPFCTRYADIKQRWLLVYSKQAHQREKKQWQRRLAKQQKPLETKWRKLCRQQFSCAEDAATALQTFSKGLQSWQTTAKVVQIEKYNRPGRPAKGDIPKLVGWCIEGELVVDEAAVAEQALWLGRFILATNILAEDELSDEGLLTCYKEQSSSVERGFRFLKDPMFFADSLFLKSPVRIQAMIMVMGLALLIYSLAERELRQALIQQDETIPDQTGKPTQRITMRRVAQIFEGIDLLIIKVDSKIVSQQVLNLTPLRLKILKLFDSSIQYCYLLDL